MRTWQSFAYWGGDVSEDAEACEDTQAQADKTGSASNRRSAYSFFQRQAVDRHTNVKTPEPELEPAMQAIMKTRHQGTVEVNEDVTGATDTRSEAEQQARQQALPKRRASSRQGNKQARRASSRGNSADTKTAEVAAQAHGQDAWRVMPQSWRAMITKEAAGCERQQPKGRRQARVASEAGRQRTQRMLKGAKSTRLRIADRRPRQRGVTMKGTSRMPAPGGSSRGGQ